VKATGVAIGTAVAIGSAPVLTGALSRLAGGPGLDARWVAATTAAVAGCAVLVISGQAAGVSVTGVGLAVAAGLCYAIYAIYAVTASRQISADNPESAVMGLFFGGAAVLLAPVLAAGSPAWPSLASPWQHSSAVAPSRQAEQACQPWRGGLSVVQLTAQTQRCALRRKLQAMCRTR
jgi:drug/metabolite transporter (DMT)-like permease